MKKVVLTAMLVAGMATASQAQIAVVPKAGINLSLVAFDDAANDNVRTRTGFVGGIGVQIGSSTKLFSLQPELLFSQKGYKGSGNDRLTVNYLEVPILGRFSIGSPTTRVYLGAGPSYAFAIGGKNRSRDKEVDLEFGDGNGRIQRSDWGLQFGLGLSQKLGTGNLQVEGRYGLGISNLNNTQTGHNRVIAFTLGYAIPLSQLKP